MEKILVIGSSGFLGHNVGEYLSKEPYFEVYRTSRDELQPNPRSYYMDLSDVASINSVINEVGPSVVINCAGIVGTVDDTEINALFTSNLLESLATAAKPVKRIIISGSAAEYGYVKQEDLPIGEMTKLAASQGYGLSKVKEEMRALDLAEAYKLPVVVARIFNPIGPGMGEKFLVSSVLRQINSIVEGKKDSVEVSRLDSYRDYIAVEDVARAFKKIVLGVPRHNIYNIGSGEATSNKELIESIIRSTVIDKSIKLVETSDIVEPLVASKADIGRMQSDFDWVPTVPLKEAINRITRKENDK